MTTLVFLESHDGDLTKGGLGLLGKAGQLGGDVAGVVLGSGVADDSDEFGRDERPGRASDNFGVFRRRGSQPTAW